MKSLAAAPVLLALLISCGHSKSGSGEGFTLPAPDDADAGAAVFGTTPEGLHACATAVQARSSVGCEYYAMQMDGGFAANNGCFVAFVANTSETSVHIQAAFAGTDIDLGSFAK